LKKEKEISLDSMRKRECIPKSCAESPVNANRLGAWVTAGVGCETGRAEDE
jgi:hypothetical protein